MKCSKCGKWHSLLEMIHRDIGRGRQYFCADCETWTYEDGTMAEIQE